MPKKTTHKTNTNSKLTIDIVAETKHKIYITLTIKTQEHCSHVSIVNFEQIQNAVLVFRLACGNSSNLKVTTWITAPLNFGLLTVAFDPNTGLVDL